MTEVLLAPARVLVTKIGLDGHDRGSRIIAAYLRDAGMEVIYTNPWQAIDAVVALALEEDVDVIGSSSLATDHLLVPKLMVALDAAGLGHVRVVVGGIAWIQTSSATVDLKAAISSAMASVGVLHPRVFLGRLFIRFATSFSHVWLAPFRSVPLGMN